MPDDRLCAIVILLSIILLSVRGRCSAISLKKGTFFSRMKPSLLASYGTGTVQIPKVDDRKYVQHILRNGIPVTVVQDEKSEKCSCALSVKTGAMYDPQPGVAHITEHAVFLGSEKYPIENAYKDFLNKHGGSSNAGTSMDQTTYKFSVNSNAFDQALDIFSQFFKGPLFRTEAMCREIMAVDSEDSKNRIIDSRRLLQVLKHQVDPDSRYSKFSTGNLHTLAYGDEKKYGQHLADTIRSFHQRYYHPHAMAVALVGPQSVDELKELAERHFSGITGDAQRDSTPKAEWEASPPRTQSLFVNGGGKLIRLRPVKDLRDMIVVWELPTTHEQYRSNPCYLLSYLLANKGEGSWFAALQDRQWATSTASGVRTHFVDFTLFEATVSLTETGLRHWHEVMELLYRSIDALSQASDAELTQYWQEMRTINSLDFQYKEKNTAYELAPHLSSNMLDYPAQHIVSAGWLMDEDFDLALFRSYLSRLSREKSVVFLRSKSFAESPLSLGSDDASYLYEQMFPAYEVHLRSRHRADANSSDSGGGATVADEAVDGESAVSSTLNSADAAIEALKLSGDYFHNLRAYQDGSGDEFHGTQRMEPFYGVPYRIDDLATAVEEAGTADQSADCLKDVKITLPAPNRFLCTELIDGSHILHEDRSSTRAREEDCASAQDTESKLESVEPEAVVRPRQSAPPVPVGGAGMSKERAWVWHSRDQVFRQPRAIYFHRVESVACEDGHPVLSLMAQVFSQVTTRKYYQPAVAGLSYSFSLGPRGVGLSFYGYSPKLAEFAAKVSRDVGELSFWSAVPASVVEMCKDRLLRTYRSWAKERPDAQCDSLLRYLLHEGTWLPRDRLAACEGIDTTYFQQRVASVLQFGRVLTYAHGDCSPEVAQVCHDAVAANIKASSGQSDADRAISAERSRLLPPGSHYTVALPAFNKEDPNSALLSFFQADMAAPEVSAHMLLLRRLLGEPAFAELRTKQQLGYIVSLSSSGYGRGWNAMRGISVRILSKRFSPAAMETSLDAFLATQRSLLQDTLTDELVRERCAAIIRSLEDPPTTYTEEASEYWDSIVHGLPFDWTAQVIAALRTLDREAVLRRAEEWLFDRATRRSVSVMVFSPEHEQERQSLVEAQEENLSGGGLRGSTGNERCYSVDDLARLRDSLPFAGKSNR